MRQPAQNSNHAGPDVGIEVLKQQLLLVDEITGDAGAEAAALSGRAQSDRSTVLGVGALLDISFLHQRRHDATRRALVQEQSLRQAAEAQRTVLDQRLERIALSDRDVVAADPVSIAKLIDPHQIGDRGLQIRGIAIESRFRRFVSLLC